MKQVLQNLKNGKTEVLDVPVPQLKQGSVLVRTAASLVSAGTERNLVAFAEKSLVGKAQSRPDLFKQVLDKARREGLLSTLESALNRLDQPLALGYSSSGTVIAAADDVLDFKPGDRVVCAGGGHAVHAEFALVPRNLISHLHDGVDFESAAFATMGAISLNGIRLANPQVGEKVAIIGLGLLGLITAQLVRAAGCDVFGMDIASERVKFARESGFNADGNDKVLQDYPALTRGRGFDKILICADTPADEPVELAGQIARDRAHVISLGVVGLNLPRKIYFEKELFFQVSRSAGPGRYDTYYEEDGQDYPIGYVRWTEGRNLEAFVDLLATGRLDMHPLITHRFPIEQAPQAYELITGKTNQPYLGVLLTYSPETSPGQSKIELHPTERIPRPEDTFGLGVLGCGNYANAIFLPAIQSVGGVEKVGVASAGGLSARHTARKFGFSFAASSSEDILSHEGINIIAILTRHQSHARYALKALQAGKHVYCEKPLAIEKTELDELALELGKPQRPALMVGFNRRFAPMAVALKQFFHDSREPFYVHYRVNAGYIPPSHWLQDPQQGGGRLIGEACHFIDFANFIIEKPPVQVRVTSLPDQGKYSRDNFTITIEYEDGSLATVAYLSNGNKRFPKEYIEVFNNGRIGQLDDFRTLNLVDENQSRKMRSALKQDKGHRAAWEAFLHSLKTGGPEPIPTAQLLLSSYTTLACQQSLVSAETLRLADFMQSN